MTQTGGGYNYSYNFNPQPIRNTRRVTTSIKELKHIAIAALLVIGIGFSIGFYQNILRQRFLDTGYDGDSCGMLYCIVFGA